MNQKLESMIDFETNFLSEILDALCKKVIYSIFITQCTTSSLPPLPLPMAKMVAFATFEPTSSRYINECQVCNVKTSDIMNKGLLLH